MDRRTHISLAIALGLHAVALVAARRCVVGQVSARAGVAEREIEVEMLAPEPSAARSEAAGASASEPVARAVARQRAERAVAREQPSERVPSVDGAPFTAPEASAAPQPAEPALSLAQLGLEGPNHYVGAPEPTAAGEAQAEVAADGVRRSIDDSLLKHDRSVGLGSEGPAIAAIEQATYASTASVNGRAVLSVVADGSGAVTGVWCSDGDHAQWDALAAAIGKALQGKHLRRPPGGRGVEMRIEVTSREEMPSGRDPGVEVRVLHLPVKKGRGPKSTRVDLLDIAPKIVIDEMPETAAAPPTWPMAHVHVGNFLAIDGDPADIGATPRRVVHARVLDEHAL